MTDIVSIDDTFDDASWIGVHHITKRILDGGSLPEQVATDYDLELAEVNRGAHLNNIPTKFVAFIPQKSRNA